jgi:hypothetical protein
VAKIYKSEIICEFCHKPILWYAIINRSVGEVFTYDESDIEPHREVRILSDDDKTARLRIRCKECDKVNEFYHTLAAD